MKMFLKISCVFTLIYPTFVSADQAEVIFQNKTQQIIKIAESRTSHYEFIPIKGGLVAVTRKRGGSPNCDGVYIRFIHASMVDGKVVAVFFDHCQGKREYKSYDLTKNPIYNGETKGTYRKTVEELYRFLAPRT